MVRIDQWWWRQARDQTWWRWFYLSERTLGLYIDELERGKRTGMSGLARIGSSWRNYMVLFARWSKSASEILGMARDLYTSYLATKQSTSWTLYKHPRINFSHRSNTLENIISLMLVNTDSINREAGVPISFLTGQLLLTGSKKLRDTANECY